MVPLVILLVPMIPMVKTVGCYSTVWAKLPTRERHMIQYDVLNSRFINLISKHCFTRMICANNRNTEI